MVTLPPELKKWILVFAPLFSKRVWQSVQVLLAGAILAVGSRTVTAILRVMGLSQEQQFQKFHRVLNRVKWSALAGSRRLLLALIDAFIPEGPLLMALDDTIERRRGAKICVKGIYRDPVRSSHSHLFKPQAFLCTDDATAPEQILAWFVQRWQIEVTFEERRTHLETQRQWSDLAIGRTTPVILALYSIVALLAKHLLEQQAMPMRSAAWYKKERATFSDTIVLVRRWLWGIKTFSMSEKSSETMKIPRDLFERLTDTLSYAA